MSDVFLDFDSAKKIVHAYGLTGREDWREYIAKGKLPSNIPRRPDHIYKKQWKGWRDWCGYEGNKPRVRFMSFGQARALVRGLGLRTLTEWLDYHSNFLANKNQAESIPVNPDKHYQEWVSLEDWLGESYAPYTVSKKKFRLPFEECRKFARKLGFKGQKEWRLWAATSSRPSEVPASPDAFYKTQGWISWPDWLGYEDRGEWLSYEDARAIVRAKGFRAYREFEEWSKTSDFPVNIPKDPRYIYASGGWGGTSDWLGNGKVSPEEHWDFYTAREWVGNYVRDRGGKITHKEWNDFAQSPGKPPQIFTNPSNYTEFLSWPDWFGLEAVEWLPFVEAREVVRNLGLQTKEDWNRWVNSDDYDPRIPKSPHWVYNKADEWSGMPDWLGTSHRRFSRSFRKFEDARAFVRSQRLAGKDDWEAWVRSPQFPIDLPVTPSKTYARNWVSWSDWLGNYGSRWSKTALVGFISSLVPVLGKLEPSELFAILRKNNCLGAIDSLGDNNPLVMITKAALNGEQALVSELTNALQSKVGDLPSLNNDEERDIEAVQVDDSVDIEVSSGCDREAASLPNLTAREILDALDEVSQTLGVSDEETINFLVDKGVSRLWQSVLGAIDQKAEVEKARAFSSDNYARTIRDRFIDEFDSVEAILIPDGYAFTKAGKPVIPNLMQRLIAHRLTTMRRVGNWSGTGAGKTLAAVLSSRVVNSEITLVIALNNTINDPDAGWALEIRSAFPRSHVQIKERGEFAPKKGAPNYLLLNYESFQLAGSRSMVEHLVRDHQIDLIVLDEIHSAKSRNTVESKRRQLLNYLITESGRNNPDLKVLGMSATPVVNSLDEAASLLEMITSKDYSDLDSRATISNALGMHQQLILNGVRYRPNYKMELHEEAIEIRADGLTDQILNLGKGDVLGLENILLEPKLPCILDLAKPGTIVFSNFVDGIFDTVSNSLRGKGLKVARFSGEDKSGLEEFKKGKADVLVGSSALGTGVDGLQYICNRLIVITLPWTSAGYEQLLGRIYRQGSRFERIEVFIPQIVLNYEGQEWSWDKQRFGRIKYKKTLADAAVDGFVPEGKLMSQGKMFAEARKILQEWISALEGGASLSSIARPDLKVPLPPEQLQTALRKYGDFSQMNARIGSSASETTNRRFNESPDEWYLYHSLYKEARKTWVEVPYVVIAESLAKRPDWVIGDFGCGEALLSTIILNKVYNFDHVAINKSVEACDMTRTGLADETLDVAVFSLSLMGLNWADYIKEAHRVLRPGGFIEVAEPASKWEGERQEELKAVLEGVGFQLVGHARRSHQFLYLRAVKV